MHCIAGLLVDNPQFVAALQGVERQMQQMQQQMTAMLQQMTAMQQQMTEMQQQQVVILNRTSTVLHMARKHNAASNHRPEYVLQSVPNPDTGAQPPAHLFPDTPKGEPRAAVLLPFAFPFDCPL